eukprot:241643_1
MGLGWSNIAFIAYFTLYLLLIIAITVQARSESLQQTESKDIDPQTKMEPTHDIMLKEAIDEENKSLKESTEIEPKEITNDENKLSSKESTQTKLKETTDRDEENKSPSKESTEIAKKKKNTTIRGPDRKYILTINGENKLSSRDSTEFEPVELIKVIHNENKSPSMASTNSDLKETTNDENKPTQIEPKTNNSNPNGMKELLKVVWTKRGIYAPILVHLYDTSTDIGVIVEWWILAKNPNNEINDAINMTVIIWLSFGFLILYRLATIAMLIYARYSVEEVGISSKAKDDDEDDSLWIDVLLSLFDVYIIKAIYKSIKNEDSEAGPRQKLLQLLESIAESLPQMVLQSVFLIKTRHIDTSSTAIVALSLAASLLSVTNKYVWFDADSVDPFAKTLDIKKECGSCVNYAYVVRIMWRFSLISLRFIIFSLVWCAIGGFYWFIFAVISYILWVTYFYIITCVEIIKKKARNPSYRPLDMNVNQYRPLLYALVAFVSYLLSKDNVLRLFIIHFVETTVSMAFITLFIFSPITCWRCTDPAERTIDNRLIELYLVSGWSFLGLQVILFCFVQNMIRDGAKEEDVFIQMVLAVSSDIKNQGLDRKYVKEINDALANKQVEEIENPFPNTMHEIQFIMIFVIGSRDESEYVKPSVEQTAMRTDLEDNGARARSLERDRSRLYYNKEEETTAFEDRELGCVVTISDKKLQSYEWNVGMTQRKYYGQVFYTCWRDLVKSGYVVDGCRSSDNKYMFLMINGMCREPKDQYERILRHSIDLSSLIFNNAKSPMCGFFPETAITKPFYLNTPPHFGTFDRFDPKCEWIHPHTLRSLRSSDSEDKNVSSKSFCCIKINDFV